VSPHDVPPGVLEQNLQRLFARAWHPVLPAPRFALELRQRLVAEVARGAPSDANLGAPVRRERNASVRPFLATARPYLTLAAAALALVAGLVATWLFVRGSSTSLSPDVIVAEGHVAVREAAGWRAASDEELERGFAAGSGAVGVATPPDQPFTVHLGSSGRVELGPRSRVEVADREADGARTIAFDAGSASVRRDDAGEPWRVETPHGLVALARGVLSWSFASDGPGGGACSLVELATGLAWIVTEPRVELSVGQRTWMRGGRVVVSSAIATPASGAARTAAGSLPGGTDAGGSGDGSQADAPVPSLSGTLPLAPGATPPPSFRVTLLRHERLPSVSQPRSAEFRGTASFAFENLRDGTYDAYFEAAGFAVARVSDLVVAAGSTANALFSVEPARSLRGLVLDAETGAPVPDAVVLAEAFLPAQVVPFQVDLEAAGWRAAATTAADGSFVVGGLSGAPTRLRVTVEGYAATWTDEITAGKRPENALTIQLARGGSVTGLVQHDDGSPWSGAMVIASRMVDGPIADRMSYTAAPTDAAGRYTIRDLPPGSYVVFSFDPSASQTVPTTRELRIVGTEVVQLDLGPTANRTRVVGVLRDTAGQPVAGMDVTLSDLGDRNKWIGDRTDPDGSFAFAGVDPGRYDLYAGTDLGARFAYVGSIEVALAPEQRQDLVFPSGSLRGQTLAPDGTPQASAWLILHSLRTGQMEFAGRTQADAAGRFEIRGLAPGTYQISAHTLRTGIAAVLSEPIDVALGAHELVIRFVPGVELLVRATDARGAPAAGRAVKFTDERGRPCEFSADDRTDAKGVLLIPGIMPGRWLVDVEGAPPQRVDLELGERRTLAFQIGGDPATTEEGKR